MVLEDDFCILNEHNFHQFITEFEKIKDKDGWDMIVLTPRGITTTRDIECNFHRIIENQTATGYIIKHSFVKQLLPVYENSISKLENGGDPNKWALDSCWKPMQQIANFCNCLLIQISKNEWWITISVFCCKQIIELFLIKIHIKMV